MRDDYLWDKKGEPDPEVEKLERMLAPFRQTVPPPDFDRVPMEVPRRRPHRTPRWLALAAAIGLVGFLAGWMASRPDRPTVHVASLEGGTDGFAFASGLAAVDAVCKLLKAGDHVVCGENVYGGTHRLMERIYAPLGLTFTFVDMRETALVEAAITPATKVIYGETPTNPMMSLADLQALGDLAQARGLLFVVDNTFATPVFQRPLEFGADVVLHSTTKYLNGHSDMVGGMLVTRRDDLAERLAFIQNGSGAVPGPMDVSRTGRGGVPTMICRARPPEMMKHSAATSSMRRSPGAYSRGSR